MKTKKDINKAIKRNKNIYKELTGVWLPAFVDVHHIDRNSNNNSPENIIALHPEEHWFAHFEMWLDAKLKGDADEERANAQSCNAIKYKNKLDEPTITGWKHSAETGRKIGEANARRVISEETRNKLIEAGKRRTLTEAQRKKIGDANRGKPKPQSVKEAVAKANKLRPFIQKQMKFLGVDYKTAKRLLGL